MVKGSANERAKGYWRIQQKRNNRRFRQQQRNAERRLRGDFGKGHDGDGGAPSTIIQPRPSRSRTLLPPYTAWAIIVAVALAVMYWCTGVHGWLSVRAFSLPPFVWLLLGTIAIAVVWALCWWIFAKAMGGIMDRMHG